MTGFIFKYRVYRVYILWSIDSIHSEIFGYFNKKIRPLFKSDLIFISDLVIKNLSNK
jgi:hypothetical protein